MAIVQPSQVNHGRVFAALAQDVFFLILTVCFCFLLRLVFFFFLPSSRSSGVQTAWFCCRLLFKTLCLLFVCSDIVRIPCPPQKILSQTVKIFATIPTPLFHHRHPCRTCTHTHTHTHGWSLVFLLSTLRHFRFFFSFVFFFPSLSLLSLSFSIRCSLLRSLKMREKRVSKNRGQRTARTLSKILLPILFPFFSLFSYFLS